ncbi:MAG: inorganic diphosphatase [Candidatus Izemoplasmatales bacterium]|uniref:Inorganic pyrophosphatase n=1 Tax=Hujiaoplasma nucleasis TaxID=2725268 RepID=A0A7L6N1Y3_9MOLU|nr:inorganic diphosphatase [Hujiaoplasma nucleasis]QLY39442.1 inorganic diphosphatase [Hujiaoplasma nucleasis]
MSRIIEAVIEIPMGTQNKYEIDKEKNRIKLNRVLYSKMTYPAEYGFIEKTLAEDNDPLDILVLATTQTFPGCIVDARVVGYLDMYDSGERDQKIIAVVDADPRFDDINDISDIKSLQLREIKLFFENYKILEPGHHVKVLDYYSKADAIELIEECQVRYTEELSKKL